MVFADYASTSPMDADVLERMLPYFSEQFGNPSGMYPFSEKAKNAIKNARETVARLINAETEEIYFTSGGTEGNNQIIKAFSESTLCSEIEHHSVLRSSNGKTVPVNSGGTVTPSALKRSIFCGCKLVSVMTVNNEIGTIQPIKELANASHELNCLFHTDAVQGIGHIRIDVKNTDVDFLSASAHKFGGPKGTGFIYIRKGISIPPFILGGMQEKGLRAGTENVPAIVGTAFALKKSCDNAEKNTSYIKGLEEKLLSLVKGLNVSFIRNGENTLPGIVSLSFENRSGEGLVSALGLMGVCVSAGAACDGKNLNTSHVIKAINVPKSFADGTIRISLSHRNTEKDVYTIYESLKKCLL